MRFFVSLFLVFAPLAASAAEAECEVYFSETDQMANRLIAYIDREKKSIKMAIYSLTHKEIACALVRARERGVAVEVLIDPFSAKRHASITALLKGKVPLFVWDYSLSRTGGAKKGSHPLMHDKFCIFGNHLVWTGSLNLTYAATNTHRENAVALDSPVIAGKYLERFAHMKLYESRPYQEYLAYYPKKRKK
jgi:phosphatidylserine/phosphatidylglycerophosphate/cardiolipin synthase-like enzyme